VKSNFGFIDDLYDALSDFKQEEEQSLTEMSKSETGR
jgi:hypothetical protein